MATNPIPICPKCKQADRVQKGTNVYNANTTEWVENEQSMDRFGHFEDRQVEHEAHTKLGLKLMPPEEPAAPSHPGLWYGVGIVLTVIILAGLCPFVITPLAIVIPIIVTHSTSLPGVLQGMNETTLIVLIGAVILIGVVIGVGLMVWLGFVIKHRFDLDMTRYHEKKEAYEQNQLRPYQRAKERWEHLYYCDRDSVVFIPTENRAIPIEDMGKYLHDPYYKY